MNNLFDFLPDDFKKSFTDNNLKIGSVLRLHVRDTKPPKFKRFIVVGISVDKISIATSYINSDININVLNTNYLKSLNYELKKDDTREYLEWNSFVDCSKVYERNFSEIKKALENNPNCNIGTLSETDLKNVKHKLSIASTISESIKRKYDFIFKINK